MDVRNWLSNSDGSKGDRLVLCDFCSATATLAIEIKASPFYSTDCERSSSHSNRFFFFASAEGCDRIRATEIPPAVFTSFECKASTGCIPVAEIPLHRRLFVVCADAETP